MCDGVLGGMSDEAFKEQCFLWEGGASVGADLDPNFQDLTTCARTFIKHFKKWKQKSITGLLEMQQSTENPSVFTLKLSCFVYVTGKIKHTKWTKMNWHWSKWNTAVDRIRHQRGLTAVISAGLISYHSIRNWKREPRYYTDGEVVLQSGDQTAKTNHSCTLKCSADSSHLIHKVTAVNTNVWVSCFCRAKCQNTNSDALLIRSLSWVAIKQTVAC